MQKVWREGSVLCRNKPALNMLLLTRIICTQLLMED